ncbi:Hepatitis delta antigen [Hepatitis delta virus]|uniref:Large delta antigen n=4 Tax=Hepatitis delta virus TaxID=12475 RepID=LHDAG_HDVP1|nr:RecName: Full=Large delta antigen; Short=L-HDAg; AltName: Full=p27; Flags: Precursor [Hepatitis delta virus (isolate Peru-1)]AAB02595.1 Hepatitis delta antigen [Hepatitis delta virus]
MSQTVARLTSKEREEILEQWVEERKNRRKLEKDLRRANKKIKKLEDENPWLGNVVGLLRRKKDEDGAPPAKRPRQETMEVDSGPGRKPKARGFTDQERRDHRRRKALENKKKQLAGGGKHLSQEEEEELRRLARDDDERERRTAGPRPGGVNPMDGPPRGAPGGGFVPSLQGVPESPFSRTGEGIDIRGTQQFPWYGFTPPPPGYYWVPGCTQQ